MPKLRHLTILTLAYGKSLLILQGQMPKLGLSIFNPPSSVGLGLMDHVGISWQLGKAAALSAQTLPSPTSSPRAARKGRCARRTTGRSLARGRAGERANGIMTETQDIKPVAPEI